MASHQHSFSNNTTANIMNEHTVPQHVVSLRHQHQHHENDEDNVASLSIMMEQECTNYTCGNYLYDNVDALSDLTGRQRITSVDRKTLVDWCYEIVDRCEFDRESVAVAMNIADRFMSSIIVVASHPRVGSAPQGCSTQEGDNEEDMNIPYNRGQYQLLIMTCLYISIKINERSTVGSVDFSAISCGAYSKQEIEYMERRILHRLEWRLCCPTTLQMGHRILHRMTSSIASSSMASSSITSSPQAAQARQVNAGLESGGVWDFLHEELAYQAENAVREYCFTTHRYSTVAAAAILNAIEQVNDTKYYEVLMQALISITKEFDFDSPHLLLYVRNRLRRLMEDNDAPTEHVRDVDDTGHHNIPQVVSMSPSTITTVVELSPKPNDNEPSQEKLLDKIVPLSTKSYSPVPDGEREDDDDDDSCVTVYY
mmetsp:Transcript_4127/g.9267  ORF Transcript_4127/g.9267 Transcript_4127/m.9267 type:complete len:426 (+) Transcript_4127:47-1324(+)